jgi:hypothetical protein
LEAFLGADAYRNRKHTVIEIDARLLIEEHGSAITLSPYNSGSTLFNPAERGPDTFASIEEFPFDYWTRVKSRQRRDAVVELAVGYAVRDISRYVISVADECVTKP